MKKINDIKLELKVSSRILELVEEAISGKLNDVPHSDLQGICEALAINIIKEVRER